MPATGNEAVKLSQLKLYDDHIQDILAEKQDQLTIPLPVNQGGTGLTASPSMLTNLGTTAAANVMTASPRPGVTGTLPIANGGTGATSASAALAALGGATTAQVNAKLNAPSTSGTAGQVLGWNGTATEWISVSQGTVYSGSNGINVSGSVISGVNAAAGTVGVVSFASDSDFNTYLGL